MYSTDYISILYQDKMDCVSSLRWIISKVILFLWFLPSSMFLALTVLSFNMILYFNSTPFENNGWLHKKKKFPYDYFLSCVRINCVVAVFLQVYPGSFVLILSNLLKYFSFFVFTGWGWEYWILTWNPCKYYSMASTIFDSVAICIFDFYVKDKIDCVHSIHWNIRISKLMSFL